MKINKLMFLGLLSIFGINNNVFAEKNFNLEKIVSAPENIMNVSYSDILSTYQAFESDSNRKSYLKYIINSYKDSYKKDDKSISILGKDGNLYYFVDLNSDKINDNKDDFGFRNLICNSEINKLFLTLGVNFEIRFNNGGKVLNKKIINNKDENACLLDIKNPESKKTTNKDEIKKEENKEVNKLGNNKIDESQIKDIKLLPPRNMPGESENKKSNYKVIDLEKKEKQNFNKDEKKDNSNNENKIELLNESSSKIIDDLIKKRGDSSINDKKISDLSDKIKKDYELKNNNQKKEYRKAVMDFIKDNYGKFLNKEIQKGVRLYVDTNKDNVNFNIKFDKESYKIAEKEIKNWSNSNEAKNFVCSQTLLKSMLELGVSYNVKYFDDKNKLVFLENLKAGKNSCD